MSRLSGKTIKLLEAFVYKKIAKFAGCSYSALSYVTLLEFKS